MLYGQHKAWSLYFQSQLYFVIILYLYLLITNSFLINFLLLFWIWRFFCKYYFVLHMKKLKSKFTKCTGGNMFLEIMIMFADYDSNLLQGYNLGISLNIKSQCHIAYLTLDFWILNKIITELERYIWQVLYII